jgi:hypothetical protein
MVWTVLTKGHGLWNQVSYLFGGPEVTKMDERIFVVEERSVLFLWRSHAIVPWSAIRTCPRVGRSRWKGVCENICECQPPTLNPFHPGLKCGSKAWRCVRQAPLLAQYTTFLFPFPGMKTFVGNVTSRLSPSYVFYYFYVYDGVVGFHVRGRLSSPHFMRARDMCCHLVMGCTRGTVEKDGHFGLLSTGMQVQTCAISLVYRKIKTLLMISHMSDCAPLFILPFHAARDCSSYCFFFSL